MTWFPCCCDQSSCAGCSGAAPSTFMLTVTDVVDKDGSYTCDTCDPHNGTFMVPYYAYYADYAALTTAILNHLGDIATYVTNVCRWRLVVEDHACTYDYYFNIYIGYNINTSEYFCRVVIGYGTETPAIRGSLKWTVTSATAFDCSSLISPADDGAPGTHPCEQDPTGTVSVQLPGD